MSQELSEKKKYHTEQAKIAKEVYIRSRSPAQDAIDWAKVLRDARKQISAALRASSFLTDIDSALIDAGAHMLVLRHLTAPPISQDQFLLFCPVWKKATEKPGGRVRASNATLVAEAFNERRSKLLTPWIEALRLPSRREIRNLLAAIAPLIASQQIQTMQRTRAAKMQEGAVISILSANGCIKEPSKALDQRAELLPKHFMHKVRYATRTSTAQEVDIALGLKETVVLAIECKVSNDETNSVKRMNDILKKSNSWKTHYGSFVTTGAVLQGVIAPKDIYRLIDEGVEVFWSHNLVELENYIKRNT